MPRRQTDLTVPIVCALLAHAGLAAGLTAADKYAHRRPPPPLKVVVELVDPPPPPPEVKAPEPEPPPPAPEPVVEPPKPVVRPKLAAVKAPEPPPQVEEPPPSPEPPAPGPPDPSPAPAPYVFKMETGAGGNMSVQSGAGPTGAPGGKPGGTGSKPGGGGGGPPESTGTGGVAAVASIKTMPKPLDSNYDHVTIKESEYPEEARRRGIEGQVVVRILVDAAGRVGEVSIVKGLGFGLDEHALKVARKLRFEPARDTTDRAVAARISWSFQFRLPEDL